MELIEKIGDNLAWIVFEFLPTTQCDVCNKVITEDETSCCDNYYEKGCLNVCVTCEHLTFTHEGDLFCNECYEEWCLEQWG